MEQSNNPMPEAKPKKSLARCGAQLRGKPGKFCTQVAMASNGRCKLHGATAGRPTLPETIARRLADKADKDGTFASLVDKYLNEPDLRNLNRSMAFLHALHDDILLKLGDVGTFSVDDVQHVLEVVAATANVIEKVSKIENSNQLTAAQVALLQVRIKEAAKFVPVERREAFLQYLINSDTIEATPTPDT